MQREHRGYEFQRSNVVRFDRFVGKFLQPLPEARRELRCARLLGLLSQGKDRRHDACRYARRSGLMHWSGMPSKQGDLQSGWESSRVSNEDSDDVRVG
eukprot:1650244-Prymnesium_polylepis.3